MRRMAVPMWWWRKIFHAVFEQIETQRVLFLGVEPAIVVKIESLLDFPGTFPSRPMLLLCEFTGFTAFLLVQFAISIDIESLDEIIREVARLA